MADAINGTGVWSVTWPWPQVFFLEYYTLFFAEDAVDTEGQLYLYEAYCDTSNVWQAAEVKHIDDIEDTSYVTVADFGPFYVVTKMQKDDNYIAVRSWQKVPGRAGSASMTQLPSSEAPVFGCATNFNGQAVIGAIESSDDFPDVSWNSVMWSEVGKFDFRVGEVDITDYDGLTTGKKFNRTSGYRHMPWGERGTGLVYQVKKLGNGVMVYGDGGIALLEPKSQPFSTFALHHISGAGILQGSAIAGDDTVHFWLDTQSRLWMCGVDYKPQKLGYKEYFESLNGIVKLSYCSDRKRLYISDAGTSISPDYPESYVLTEYGLYSTDQRCTSVGTYHGTLCGFFKDGDDKEIRLATDTLDFGQRSLKTLETLEFGANYHNADGDILQARVDWRSDYQSDRESFNELGYTRLSPKGTVSPIVTASEFRVRLKGATYVDSTANIDYIKMRIKLVDKQTIRGVYGTT